VRARSDMGTGLRRLLTCQAAAHGFEVQTSIFSGLYGTAHGLANEGRHFDPALLDIQNDRARGWKFRWRSIPIRARVCGSLLLVGIVDSRRTCRYERAEPARRTSTTCGLLPRPIGGPASVLLDFSCYPA